MALQSRMQLARPRGVRPGYWICPIDAPRTPAPARAKQQAPGGARRIGPRPQHQPGLRAQGHCHGPPPPPPQELWPLSPRHISAFKDGLFTMFLLAYNLHNVVHERTHGHEIWRALRMSAHLSKKQNIDPSMWTRSTTYPPSTGSAFLYSCIRNTTLRGSPS